MTTRPAFWKLPARFAPVAFAFFMSVLVAFVMSLAITAMNIGLADGFLLRVLRSYAAAWPVAFVSVLAARPLVLKLVALTVAGAGGR
ncbi:MAG: DUF2798 domain-containing protein [Pseudomonadota bacterium]